MKKCAILGANGYIGKHLAFYLRRMGMTPMCYDIQDEKRENYNTGAEGHRVPNCPEEKKKLILEAFKHFKMI